MSRFDFVVKGQKHHIGSKLYPVASKKNMGGFISELTEEYENDEFWGFLDELSEHEGGFPSGYCYSNSEKVVRLCKALGINGVFYAGWWFPAPHVFPTHHSWVVIDGKYLIDVSINNKVQDYIKENVDMSDENWREKIAKGIAEIQKKIVPVRDYCVSGKVSVPNIYCGSPDSYEYSRKMFRDLMRKYPQHPTYAQQGRNKLDKSWLQKEVDKHS